MVTFSVSIKEQVRSRKVKRMKKIKNKMKNMKDIQITIKYLHSLPYIPQTDAKSLLVIFIHLLSVYLNRPLVLVRFLHFHK